MSEIFDKAKQMAEEAVEKVKGAVSSDKVDEAIDSTAEQVKKVTPDSVDPKVDEVAQKAKDIT